jgi:hypothetical protein
MEVIMRATMSAAKLRRELVNYSGTVDVQETVPAGAFSGGGRPQSAPADSVEGLAAKARPRPVQGRIDRSAQAD